MSKHFLEHDAETGTTEYIHLDGSGKAVIESIQDCEPILEYNAQMAELFDKKQEYWRIGTIPNSVQIQWMKESGTRLHSREWVEYAKKQMNSAEYSKLNPNRIRI